MPPSLGRYAFALAPLAAAALWGGMYVVSKWGFALIPPVTLGFLRVALGAGALWLVVAGRGGFRADSRRVAGVRRAGRLGDADGRDPVRRHGTDQRQSGIAADSPHPVFTVLLGAVVLGERVTTVKAGGMTVAGVGTAVVIAGQYDLGSMAAGNALGVALLLIGSAAWAGYTVWGLRAVRRHGALRAATYSSLASVPMLGVLAAVELWYLNLSPADLPLTAESVAAVLYLGLASTAAAWYLWYKGLEYVPAGTVAVFFFAQPAVGAALGAALLGEALGPEFLVGGVLMAVGIWIVSRERAETAGNAGRERGVGCPL